MSDDDDCDDDVDLNPHKVKRPPLPPAPEGWVWHGFHPNEELITLEEMGRRFVASIERNRAEKAQRK